MTSKDQITALRNRIISDTEVLAGWTSADASNTTTLDCRIEYFRIRGMIDALDFIGGGAHIAGLHMPLSRALRAANAKCIDIDRLRVCTR